MTFPKGNAQVGDAAMYMEHPDVWTVGWVVSEVGLPNEHGYRLNVALTREGRREVVSPVFGRSQHAVMIIPTARPSWLVLDKYPEWIIPVRDGGNGDEARFQLVCNRCMSALVVEIKSVEHAEITYEARGVYERDRPDLMDCYSEVRCDCGTKGYEELKIERP